MKILILTDYYPPDKLGGVGEIAKNLKTVYEAKGHETWVLTTGTSAGEERVIRSSASLMKGVFLNNIETIKLIRKHRFDVINAHQSTTMLFLLTKYVPFLYKKFPKVVNSFQVSYFSEFNNVRSIKPFGRKFTPTRKEYIEKWVFAPIHILLDWIGFGLSNEITVVSSENKKEFERTYGRLSRKKIKIIPNGVDARNFAPGKPKLPADLLRQLRGKTVLLYVGVFRVRKRVFNLLFALHEVIKNNDKVILVLVGGGRGYEEGILRLVKELGLEDNVVFVGKVPNDQVINYLNAADVFCTLSSYEGMPIAILEAMASGKAILTSRVSGMIDLVSDGEDGYLTKVDDTKQIAKKLQLLVDNPAETKAMGEHARKKVVDHYSWDHIANEYLKLFERS
jgi:glycosyltransferase involved in cell wall biosynthesis